MSNSEQLSTVIEHMERYLTFKIKDEFYGINIHCVKEIIAMIKITPVPNMPEFIQGVINLRGQIIPVVDMRLKFGLPEKEYNAQTIIIIVLLENRNGSGEQIQVGFIVDATNEVLPVKASDIVPAPQFGTKINTDFIESVYQDKEKVIMIINLKNIFTEEDYQLIEC